MNATLGVDNQLAVHPEMACIGWSWENKPVDLGPLEFCNVQYACRICGKSFIVPIVGPPENRGKNAASDHGEECAKQLEAIHCETVND